MSKPHRVDERRPVKSAQETPKKDESPSEKEPETVGDGIPKLPLFPVF